jgi:hypothetical protein
VTDTRSRFIGKIVSRVALTHIISRFPNQTVVVS